MKGIQEHGSLMEQDVASLVEKSKGSNYRQQSERHTTKHNYR